MKLGVGGISLRGDPLVNNPSVFSLVYSNVNSALDLIGLRHAVIRVTSFTCSGDVRLYLNGGPTPTPITLSGRGITCFLYRCSQARQRKFQYHVSPSISSGALPILP